MSFTVDTHEIDQLAKGLAGAERIVHEEMVAGMTRSALAVEASAKQLAPVQTGNLRRSISHQVTAQAQTIRAVVGTNVPYAVYVEEGRGAIDAGPGRVLRFVIDGEVFFRRRVGPAQAKPFLAPALKANRAKIQREFASAVPKRIAARVQL